MVTFYVIIVHLPLCRIQKKGSETSDYQVITKVGNMEIPNNLTELNMLCPIMISPALNKQFANTFTNMTRTNQLTLDLSEIDSCLKFKRINGDQPKVSKEELEFPLAFSFTIHKEFIQFARLFKAVYRHHNVYCIHVDAKSPMSFHTQLTNLATCFGLNVHVIPRERSIPVQWGDLGTLEAWILCADYLLNQQSRIRWQYLLNGSGQEFPLRTNWELVRALKAINRSNVVESTYPNTGVNRAPNQSASFNFTWFKGSFYTALRSDMVQFVRTNKYAKEMLALLRTEGHLKKSQDELFFTTLNSNAQFRAPGGCPEVHPPKDFDPKSLFIARYAEWYPKPCVSGLQQREVCIIGVKHIPVVITRPEFFVNKFIDTFQPLAYDCLEWWLFQKITHEQISGHITSSFNESIYANLYCSETHL